LEFDEHKVSGENTSYRFDLVTFTGLRAGLLQLLVVVGEIETVHFCDYWHMFHSFYSYLMQLLAFAFKLPLQCTSCLHMKVT